MKELSIEQKAKRYDKALDEAKAIHKAIKKDLRPVIEQIFPELQESDDAKMWKLLKKYVHYNISDTVLEADHITREYLESWLEKQGEQKTSWSEEDENSFLNVLWCCKKAASIAKDENEMGTVWCAEQWLKSLKERVQPKQGEQNSVDKVEPKFKVGDWISDGNITIQIEAIKNNCYSYCGDCTLYSIKTADKVYHLWTIEDAKDGDVLANDKSVFIYAKVLYNKPYAYCGVDKYGVFKDDCLKYDWSNSVDNIHPATKEQRDLLFQKMQEADYEWNVEKKVLEGIKPKFKVGDWVVNKFGDSWHIDSFDKKNYQVSDGKGNYNYFPKSKQDEMHLWTIQDAKDGDVLATDWYQGEDSWEKIIIFKKYHNKGVEGLIHTPCVEGYGNTFKNGEMAFDEEVPYYSKTWTDNLHPATKEQRDLLFARMKEEGCQWDKNKKEVIKL